MKGKLYPSRKDRVIFVLQGLALIALGVGLFALGWFGVSALAAWVNGT